MKKVLLLTLNTFSATGGIEKVCRIAGKALHEITQDENGEAFVYSIYDEAKENTEPYFPHEVFKGFEGSKIKFALAAIKKGRTMDVVILSHVNLLSIGYFIKKLSPKTKLFLIAHGIEIWQPLKTHQNIMLKAIDLFLPVSAFTSEKLHQIFSIPSNKIRIVNNCLDPFIKKISEPKKEASLKKKYGFEEDDFVLLTLARLKFSEQYKGYDKVVKAIASLKEGNLKLKYLVVGKYDDEEKQRLDKIIFENNMQGHIVFAGFVNDEDLVAHFNIADAYIMPSTGEGFGIVFIEALFYSKPVIAGNKDGSVDALAGGKLGVLVNPDNINEIASAIIQVGSNKSAFIPDEKMVMDKFGYEQYKKQWHGLLFQQHSKQMPPGQSKLTTSLAEEESLTIR